VPSITSPDCALPLFEAIATYGDAALHARGRALLDAFPAAHLMAQAQRGFFAAIVARRDGDELAAERLASQAQLAFEGIEHYYHAARCIELAGRRAQAHQRYLAIGAVRDARRTADATTRRGRPRGTYAQSRQRREVLELLLAGATTKTIAAELGVSVRTIKHRVAEIFAIENVANRAELCARRADLRSRAYPR
jgi:DNA-binding NarL/FixJ family response regulator